jgi:hypothetical protein
MDQLEFRVCVSAPNSVNSRKKEPALDAGSFGFDKNADSGPCPPFSRVATDHDHGVGDPERSEEGPYRGAGEKCGRIRPDLKRSANRFKSLS